METTRGLSVIIPAFLIGAGVALSLGLFVGVASLVRRSRLYALFSAMCLCAAGDLVASAGYHTTALVPTAAAMLRWQLAFALLLFVAWFWFAALYSEQHRVDRCLAAVCAVFGALLAIDLASACSLRFTSLYQVAPIHLPWGESLRRFTGEVSHWTWLAQIAMQSVCAWILWRAVTLSRRGERRRAALLIAGCLLQTVSTATAALVDSGRLHLFSVEGFAFLGLILLTSASLWLDTQERKSGRAESGPVHSEEVGLTE